MDPEREYPKVHGEFERDLKDGRRCKFQIEDVPQDMWDAVVEFMMKHYVQEEVWCAAAGTANDPRAIQEYRVLLSSIMRAKMSTACFLVAENGEERTLVGVSIAILQKKDEIVDHRPPSSKAGLRTLRMFMEVMKVTALFDKYGVSEYLMGAGLFVLPEYRGLGLAVAMLEARKAIARELGIKVTGGIFTGVASQRTAEKAHLDVVYELTYAKFGDQCGFHIDTSTPSLKIYGIAV